MQWKSNAKYSQSVEEGTIFTLKSDARIVIHKYHGYGESWYLSCYPLGIEREPLNTEDFNTAVENAKAMISRKLKTLNYTYTVFASDVSKTEIVRY